MKQFVTDSKQVSKIGYDWLNGSIRDENMYRRPYIQTLSTTMRQYYNEIVIWWLYTVNFRRTEDPKKKQEKKKTSESNRRFESAQSTDTCTLITILATYISLPIPSLPCNSISCMLPLPNNAPTNTAQSIGLTRLKRDCEVGYQRRSQGSDVERLIY